MTENDTSLEAVRKAFAEYFGKWSIELPRAAIATRLRCQVKKAGWTIQYLFGQERDREYLDFYATHRMTNDRHVRIWDDGQTEPLEGYQEMCVYDPRVPGDKERVEREYYEHNRRVSCILGEKGFR